MLNVCTFHPALRKWQLYGSQRILFINPQVSSCLEKKISHFYGPHNIAFLEIEGGWLTNSDWRVPLAFYRRSLEMGALSTMKNCLTSHGTFACTTGHSYKGKYCLLTFEPRTFLNFTYGQILLSRFHTHWIFQKCN